MLQAILPKSLDRIETNVSITKKTERAGVIKRISTWVNKQEENRFFWLGFALMGGIGTIVPITLLAVVFWANNSFALWTIVCIVNVPVLVVNLAAQPVKIILPVIFSAWLINAAVILYSAIVFLAG